MSKFRVILDCMKLGEKYKTVINIKSVIFYVYTDSSLDRCYEQYKMVIESVAVKIS